MLDPLEKKLIELVIFDESFESIVAEMNESRPIVGDVLKTLLVKEMVNVTTYNAEKGRFERSLTYDGDHLENYSFVATRKGLQFAGMM